MKNKGRCLICYADLRNDTSLSSFFSSFPIICNKCLKSFPVYHEVTEVNKVETMFLYYYDGVIKNLIYQYKGCYDYVLKDVFLYPYKKELKKKYEGYTIIYPPSNKEENEKRGYIHIKEMVKCLDLKTEDLFYKVKNYKQSDQAFKDREQIRNIIKVKKEAKITNKKYLIVDDIYTSGSTLKAIIGILVENHVYKSNIKALIIAKTKNITEL